MNYPEFKKGETYYLFGPTIAKEYRGAEARITKDSSRYDEKVSFEYFSLSQQTWVPGYIKKDRLVREINNKLAKKFLKNYPK